MRDRLSKVRLLVGERLSPGAALPSSGLASLARRRAAGVRGVSGAVGVLLERGELARERAHLLHQLLELAARRFFLGGGARELLELALLLDRPHCLHQRLYILRQRAQLLLHPALSSLLARVIAPVPPFLLLPHLALRHVRFTLNHILGKALQLLLLTLFRWRVCASRMDHRLVQELSVSESMLGCLHITASKSTLPAAQHGRELLVVAL
mmetsp:Transcript_31314/g.73814  ORF Transcript_31314/g.73814 Transcript_31314/m.73814 type:complete len:210 (-) Transcript_31314:571-1200(-)